jgi:signal peptidase II
MNAPAGSGGSVTSGAPPRGAVRSPAARQRVTVVLAVAAAVIAADVATKAVVVATLSGRPPLRVLGNLLTLRVTRNAGAAFGAGPSLTVVFAAIAAA